VGNYQSRKEQVRAALWKFGRGIDIERGAAMRKAYKAAAQGEGAGKISGTPESTCLNGRVEPRADGA
jgi:hypothetical protein